MDAGTKIWVVSTDYEVLLVNTGPVEMPVWLAAFYFKIHVASERLFLIDPASWHGMQLRSLTLYFTVFFEICNAQLPEQALRTVVQEELLTSYYFSECDDLQHLARSVRRSKLCT